MGRRSKQTVKGRAKTHRARVKAGHKMRVRRKSRGFRLASAKRKRRAQRRMNKKTAR